MHILSPLSRLFKRIYSAILRIVVPVKKSRVFCIAQGGQQYSCNPKYIAEYLMEFHPKEFEIVFSFINPEVINFVDSRIRKVRKNSFKEIFFINTAEFLISNYRLNDMGWGWHKRKEQKYIMTWHGSMALKRVEFDAKESLPKTYLKSAERDSQNIDLMLSDSVWCSDFTRRAFHYKGEILERGLPRNDIFFSDEKMLKGRKRVLDYYKIQEDFTLILYAPTFRDDNSIDNYILEWDDIRISFERKIKSRCIVLVRIHPGIKDKVNFSIGNKWEVIDATEYPDMQELMCATDILITDYSSTMFEVAISRKPCFLYVCDVNTYSRGTYFSFNELPFPFAYDAPSFLKCIADFDVHSYRKAVNEMFSNTFHYVQDGHASEYLAAWMKRHSI